MSLSETVLRWLWAPGLTVLTRMEGQMASQEARLQQSIGRLSGQADQIVAELRRISALLAEANARPEVDLTEEIAAVDALAARLDAEAPDAPAVVEPPVAPV